MQDKNQPGAPSLPTNIRLDLKGSLGTNGLADLDSSSVMGRKDVLTLTPEYSIIKPFTVVIYVYTWEAFPVKSKV